MSRAGPREPSASAADMSYGDYLDLEHLLAAQHPLSDNHNELLFIIQHQTTELWLKLMLHELRAAQAQVRRDELGPAFKMLARVSRIMGQLIQAWDVLSTLTPSEYTDFRAKLGHASGFQSYQYRAVEFTLGNKDRRMLAIFNDEPPARALLVEALAAPSVYDEFLRYLARHGHDVPVEILQRDVTLPYAYNADLVPVFVRIYEDPEHHWEAYEACEELVDLEENFQLWRFRHLKTV